MYDLFILSSIAGVIVAAVLLGVFLLGVQWEDDYLDEINRKIDEENNS